MKNASEMLFVLEGLNESISNKRAYFCITLLAYLLTISVNLTLIVTIILEKTLHEPMFILLCNLCINGIFGASTFYPKILVDLSSDLSIISYHACLGQIFVIYSYVFCEVTTLAVMAYDRYVAICKPLSYHSIITPWKTVKWLLFVWLFSVSETVILVGLTVRLPICGLKIEKVYCINWALVKLSCVDTTVNNIYGYILMFCHTSQALVILFSYVNIARTSVRSQEGRNKFTQTCLPHLISLTNFTLALVFDIMYARYGSQTHLTTLRDFMAVEYLVVPPLLNPLIYGLNLSQIRKKIFCLCNEKRNVAK